MFFEGTKQQQEGRLKELRLDPQLREPWSDDEIEAFRFHRVLLKPDFSAAIGIKYGFNLIAAPMPAQTLDKRSAQLNSFSSSAPAILKEI